MRDGRRQGSSRVAIALAASLLLHAVVFVVFLRSVAIRLVPAPEPPVMVELRELPREPAPRAAPPRQPAREPAVQPPPERAAPRAPGTAAPPGARVAARPSGPPAPPAPAAQAGGGAAPAPGGAPHGPARPSPSDVGEWFAEQGLGGKGAGTGRGEGNGAGDLLTPVPRDVKRAIQDGPPGSGNARERANRMASELRAADVSRYPERRWTVLRDRIGQGFEPTPESVGDAATGGLAGSFVRSYGGYASQYGKHGSPYPDAEDGPGRANAAINSTSEMADGAAGGPGGGDGGFERRMAAARGYAPREVIATGRTAVVAMEQDARGVVVGVWLVRSSGSEAYDVQAMRQLEKLRGQAVPAPWGAAITEWAFRTDVAITPFTPGVGGTFDLGFKGPKLDKPLEPRVRAHPPELVAIRPVRDGKGGPG